MSDKYRLPALLVFTDKGPDGYQYSGAVGMSGNVVGAVVISDAIGVKVLVSVDSESTSYDRSDFGDQGEVLIECIEAGEDQVGFFVFFLPLTVGVM